MQYMLERWQHRSNAMYFYALQVPRTKGSSARAPVPGPTCPIRTQSRKGAAILDQNACCLPIKKLVNKHTRTLWKKTLRASLRE